MKNLLEKETKNKTKTNYISSLLESNEINKYTEKKIPYFFFLFKQI